MFLEGNIIYFTPFYFKDGGNKPKYFLVLKTIGNNTLLASLPSSQHHLPRNLAIEHGCIEIPDSCINCYVFKANAVITDSGWHFDLDTFLYGQWLDEYSIDILTDIYAIQDVDYQIVGCLKADELKKVIDCFRLSASVKRKYKRWLGG